MDPIIFAAAAAVQTIMLLLSVTATTVTESSELFVDGNSTSMTVLDGNGMLPLQWMAEDASILEL